MPVIVNEVLAEVTSFSSTLHDLHCRFFGQYLRVWNLSNGLWFRSPSYWLVDWRFLSACITLAAVQSMLKSTYEVRKRAKQGTMRNVYLVTHPLTPSVHLTCFVYIICLASTRRNRIFGSEVHRTSRTRTTRLVVVAGTHRGCCVSHSWWR